MLLTRSPLYAHPKVSYPFDLHVLSTPPAFILSQDQTLRSKREGHRCPSEEPIWQVAPGIAALIGRRRRRGPRGRLQSFLFA